MNKIFGIFILVFFSLQLWAIESNYIAPFGNLPTITKKESKALNDAFSLESTTEIRRALEKFANSEFATAGTFFNLGNLYYKDNDFANAAKYYLRALDEIPNFFMARKNLAYALNAQNKKDLAYVEFTKALALSGGSDVDILLWLSSYFAKKSDWSTALNCIERALIYSPDNKNANFTRAIFFYELGRFTESAKTCEIILSKNPNDQESIKLLAKSRAKLGDVNGAIAAFSLLSNSNDSKIKEFCADIFYNQGAYSEAAKIYLELNDDTLSLRAAKALVLTGNTDDALKILEKLSDSYDSFIIKAMAFLAKKDNISAKSMFLKAEELKPLDAVSDYKLANIYFADGDFIKAKLRFMRASNDEKTQIASLYGKMNCEIALRQNSEAIKTAQVIYSKTNSADILEYIKLLERTNAVEQSK